MKASDRFKSGRVYGCLHCDAKDMTLQESTAHNSENHPETITRRTVDSDDFFRIVADMKRSLGR